MPRPTKLSLKSHKTLERLVQAGFPLEDLSEAFGISIAYIRSHKMLPQRETIKPTPPRKKSLYEITKIHEVAIETPMTNTTIKIKKAFEIGRYKNGSPILAYAGDICEPVVSYLRPLRVKIEGIDEPLYLTQGALRAFEENPDATGQRNFFLLDAGAPSDGSDLIEGD